MICHRVNAVEENLRIEMVFDPENAFLQKVAMVPQQVANVVEEGLLTEMASNPRNVFLLTEMIPLLANVAADDLTATEMALAQENPLQIKVNQDLVSAVKKDSQAENLLSRMAHLLMTEAAALARKMIFAARKSRLRVKSHPAGLTRIPSTARMQQMVIDLY